MLNLAGQGKDIRDKIFYRMEDVSEYVFKWGGDVAYPKIVAVDDETFRDGRQASYVCQPPREARLTALHIMDRIGIEYADIGFPRNGPTDLVEVANLVRDKLENGLRIKLSCAGRTDEEDIRAIIRASELGGETLRADLFISSSEILRLARRWDLVNDMLPNVKKSVSLAVQEGLPVMFVTEDTTRAHPETIRVLYEEAIQCGATRICVADTVGYATPDMTTALIEFIQREVVKDQDIKVDWHGHRDQGWALANAWAAAKAGVDCIHATAGGVGERAGNLEMHLLLNFLNHAGIGHYHLEHLMEYAQFMSRIMGVPIPVNEPLVGASALETVSGVHASAMLHAYKQNLPDLAGVVYYPFPPNEIGRQPMIRIGRMSGISNVKLALKILLDREPKSVEVQAIHQLAQVSDRTLSNQEILLNLERLKDRKD